MELTDEDILGIASRLEHSGLTDDDIDAHFLAHYGVKGMRWGQRKARAEARRESGIGGPHPEIPRSGTDKLGIAAAAYGSYIAGGIVTQKLLAKHIMKNANDSNLPGKVLGLAAVTAVGSIGAGALGVKYTRRLIDKHNQTRVSDFVNKPKDYDEPAVHEHLKTLGVDMDDPKVKAKAIEYLKVG